MKRKAISSIGKIGLFLLLPALLLFWPGKGRSQSPFSYFYVASSVDVNGFESVGRSNEATCALTAATPKCNLSWTAAVVPLGGASIAGYNMYRGTKAGGPYTKINATLISGVTYQDIYAVPNPPTGLGAVPGS